MAEIFGQESDIHFGTVDKPLVDWRKEAEEYDPDDEVLEATPEDVIRILGFDPLELEDEKDEDDLDEKGNPYHDSQGRFASGRGGGASLAPDTGGNTS